MVFTDFPGLPSAESPVVNNLDLTLVEMDTGFTLYGNGLEDSVNNVEQVTHLHS